jgi:hypothetical protein
MKAIDVFAWSYGRIDVLLTFKHFGDAVRCADALKLADTIEMIQIEDANRNLQIEQRQALGWKIERGPIDDDLPWTADDTIASDANVASVRAVRPMTPAVA